MKVLFLLRYSPEQASSRVRGLFVAEELRKRGIKCHIICGYGKKAHMSFLARFLRHDVIYFQKRYSQRDIQLSNLARLMGKKTIFDIDDAPAGTGLSPIAEKQAIEMIKNCSAVLVGSHKLLDFSKRFNRSTYIVPSSINLWHYKAKRKKGNRDYITLGWIGNGINYKYDLLMLLKPLENLSKKYDLKLTVIGALEQREIHKGFGKLRNMEVEIIDHLNWADPLAVPGAINDFDIGLYPLLDNEYNQYKGGFKALEYMAMGFPVLGSPIGENKFIIEHGTDGFLINNGNEWERHLSYLIENENARKRMGEMGRDKVERNYSTEIIASKLIDIFENIGGKKLL